MTMKTTCLPIAVLGFLSCFPAFYNCQTFNDSSTLVNNLMSGYNKHVRPVEDQALPVHVRVGLYLLNIPDFDEVTETLTSVVSLVVSWTDCNMQWTPSDYNDTTTVSVSYKDVWIPEVVIMNPTDGMDSLGKNWHIIRYLNDGYCWWVPGGTLKTSCAVDVTKYPFDSQTCYINIYPWGYLSGEIDLSLFQVEGTSVISKRHYTENGAWALGSLGARIENVGSSGNEAKFHFTLKRKPTFVLVNVVVPILALSLLNGLVFVLPVDSGERVSYSITMLLSIAVFMTIVSEELPGNSEPMAVIAYVLMLQLVFSGLIMVITICNLRLYYKDESNRVPSYLKAIVSRLHRGCFRGQVRPEGDSKVQRVTVKSVEEKMSTSDAEVPMRKSEQDDELRTQEVTWKCVSDVVDSSCLVFFLLVNILTYVVYFAMALSS